MREKNAEERAAEVERLVKLADTNGLGGTDTPKEKEKKLFNLREKLNYLVNVLNIRTDSKDANKNLFDTLATQAAVSVGDPNKGIYRQIKGVAAGMDESDAVNVAQLKAAETHYLSVKTKDNLIHNNWRNDGAKGDSSIALGVNVTAETGSSIALGNGAKAGIGENDKSSLDYYSNDLSNIENRMELQGMTEEQKNLYYNLRNGQLEHSPYLSEKLNTSGEVSIGKGEAIGRGAITIGTETGQKAIGNNAINIGGYEVYGHHSIGIGTYSAINGHYITSLGNSNHISGEEINAVGSIMYLKGSQNNVIGSRIGIGGKYNVALGNDITAVGAKNVLLGNGAKALSSEADGTSLSFVEAPSRPQFAVNNATVLGNNSRVAADGGSTLGTNTLVEGTNGIAIGTGAQALAANAISIGTGNQVYGENSGAIGDPSIIDTANSYSVGNNNNIGRDSDGTFVLGNNVNIGEYLPNSTALGNHTNVTQAGGVALGAGAVANIAANVTGYDPLGKNTYTAPQEITALTGQVRLVFEKLLLTNTTLDEAITAANNEGTLSSGDKIIVKAALSKLKQIKDTNAFISTLSAVGVGDVSRGILRQITGVAAGTNDTDAVNVAQLKAAQTHYFCVNDKGIVKGNFNNDGAKGENAIAIGTEAKAPATSSIALGDNATITDWGASVDSSAGIAIGKNALATGSETKTALGGFIKIELPNKSAGIAIGKDTQAFENSVNIGQRDSAIYDEFNRLKGGGYNDRRG